MFLVHKEKEKDKGRRLSLRLPSFFFIILSDHPFPIYVQSSLATCPLSLFRSWKMWSCN